MKYRELHKLLESKNFFIKKYSKHIIYTNGVQCVAVPHSKDISVGTLRDILTVVYGSRDLAKRAMTEAA